MPDLSGLQEDMVNYFKHAALEVKTSAIGEVEMPIGGFVSQGWVLTESENLKKLLATPIDELFAGKNGSRSHNICQIRRTRFPQVDKIPVWCCYDFFKTES